MENLVRSRRERTCFKWRVARQHLVKNHACREHIGARVDHAALELFGRHVFRRADDQSRLRERTVGLAELVYERPRETKVEKLDAVARQKDVRGLQIAVNEPQA